MSSKGNNKPTQTTTTQTQSGPPAWATPYYQQLLTRATDLSNRPYTPYTGQRTAGFSADQVTAQQMNRDTAFQNNDANNLARSRLMDTIGGEQENPYAAQLGNWSTDANPYIDGVVNNTLADVTRAYGSTQGNMLGQFGSGGAFGGSAHQEAMANSQNELAQNLGRTAGNLRYQDYSAQQDRRFNGLNAAAGYADAGRNRAQQAALGMPSFNAGTYGEVDRLNQSGGEQQALWQQLLNNDYGDFMGQQNWDQSQLDVLGNALNTIGGTYQTGGTSQTGANPNYQSTGQQAAGWAALIGSLWGGKG